MKKWVIFSFRNKINKKQSILNTRFERTLLITKCAMYKINTISSEIETVDQSKSTFRCIWEDRIDFPQWLYCSLWTVSYSQTYASFDIHNIRKNFYYLILDECMRLFDHLLKDVIQIDKIIPWILWIYFWFLRKFRDKLIWILRLGYFKPSHMPLKGFLGTQNTKDSLAKNIVFKYKHFLIFQTHQISILNVLRKHSHRNNDNATFLIQ